MKTKEQIQNVIHEIDNILINLIDLDSIQKLKCEKQTLIWGLSNYNYDLILEKLSEIKNKLSESLSKTEKRLLIVEKNSLLWIIGQAPSILDLESTRLIHKELQN